MASMRIFLLLTAFVACISLCCCEPKARVARFFKQESEYTDVHVLNSHTCKKALDMLWQGVKKDRVARLIYYTQDADQCKLNGVALSKYLNLNKIHILDCRRSEMDKRKALCEGTANNSLKKYCAACIEKAETFCAGWSSKEVWLKLSTNQDPNSCKLVSGSIDTFIKNSGDETKPIRQTIKDFCVEGKHANEYRLSDRGPSIYLGNVVVRSRKRCQVCREARELLLDIDPDLEALIESMNGYSNDDYSKYFERCDIFEATPECQPSNLIGRMKKALFKQ